MKQDAFAAFYQPAGDAFAPVQTRGSLRSQQASTEGAEAVQPHLEKQQQQVLDCYRKYGPLCDYEVHRKTHLDTTSVIPRRRALMKLGLVIEVGWRENPKSGRRNTAYDLVPR